jgi:putative phosphoesterase
VSERPNPPRGGGAPGDWRRTPEAWPAPLTVGVVSDTHLYPEPAGRDLPPTLLDELAKADVGLILHAGDILAPWVLDRLAALAPTLAVYGNVDPAELRRELPPARVVTVGAHRLGLVHGHEGRGGTTPRRARSTFARSGEGAVGCVVFGHSHRPLSRLEAGVLLFNPGSPTDRRGQPYYSFGLLRIADTIEPELVCFL